MKQLTCFDYSEIVTHRVSTVKSSVMSTRSKGVLNQALSVDPIRKSQLHLLDDPSNEMDTDLIREPIWKTSRSHCVEFEETNPSLQFRCLGE